jgi:hypothetical protein
MPDILIIGASRGIGLGLADEFSGRGWNVTATVRDAGKAPALEGLGNVTVETLDIADQASAAALAERLGGRSFDAVIINAGISGPQATPKSVDHDAFAELFVTNSLAPVRLAEMLVKLVKPQTGVIGFMTSQLGSVANNTGGGMELYRASKAALNSFTRSNGRSSNPTLALIPRLQSQNGRSSSPRPAQAPTTDGCLCWRTSEESPHWGTLWAWLRWPAAATVATKINRSTRSRPSSSAAQSTHSPMSCC